MGNRHLKGLGGRIGYGRLKGSDGERHSVLRGRAGLGVIRRQW